MNNRKNILVTGGAGFLGSHLCKKLLEKDNNVICVDNFYSSSKDNITDLLKFKNFTFINKDICNFDTDIKIDQIYNLACPASPVHYQLDPVKTIQTNVLGAIKVLELAKKNNAKILQASTSEVYGDPKINPQNENYWGNVNPIGIRSCYDEGKRCAETLFFDYHRQFNLRIKICRIFNTYGPRMHQNDGRVVSNFIMQSLKNESITIYGNGLQTRSFCYVDDLIKGLLDVMKTGNIFLGPINLGNNYEISILELAKKIIKITKSQSEIKFLEALTDDPVQRRPELSLAKKIIDWSCTIELEEGLKKTSSYFLSKYFS
jgi:UDP-glucuronate decarboxylase